MTDDEIRAFVQATVAEALARRERARKPPRADPLVPVLAAFLAGRERVTMADVLPVLGFARSTAATRALAGHVLKSVGWRRLARETDPAGDRTWYYEPA